jgi:hypothetical protein
MWMRCNGSMRACVAYLVKRVVVPASYAICRSAHTPRGRGWCWLIASPFMLLRPC